MAMNWSRSRDESLDDLSPGPSKRARGSAEQEDSNHELSPAREGVEGEEEGGEGEEEGEEDVGGDDVATQVDAFFADLDVDYQRQKRRLLSDLTALKVHGTHMGGPVVYE